MRFWHFVVFVKILEKILIIVTRLLLQTKNYRSTHGTGNKTQIHSLILSLLTNEYIKFQCWKIGIYNRKDCTLRELVTLIKQERPAARQRNGRLSIAFVYPDKDGRYSFFHSFVFKIHYFENLLFINFLIWFHFRFWTKNLLDTWVSLTHTHTHTHRMRMKHVAEIHAHRPSRDDNKTLHELSYTTGDYIDVAILLS